MWRDKSFRGVMKTVIREGASLFYIEISRCCLFSAESRELAISNLKRMKPCRVLCESQLIFILISTVERQF